MYGFNNMQNIVIKAPACQDNFKVLSPGLVGSVGDVNMATRFRTSCAALFPVKFDNLNGLPLKGSSLQDGDTIAQFNGGGYPATVDHFKLLQTTDVGDRWQDKRQNDRYVEPIVAGQNQYDFKNIVAQVNQAKVTGNRFLPMPNGYQPTDELTRGGLFPTVVAQAGAGVGSGIDVAQDIFGRMFARELKAPTTTTTTTTSKG